MIQEGRSRSLGDRAFVYVWWEHSVPVTKVRGSRRGGRSMFMRLLAGMWLRLVAGRSQSKSVRGPAVCGYVRTLLWTLNFAIDKELLNRKVEDTVNVTSAAY